MTHQTDTGARPLRDLPFTAILAFFAITFAITWSIAFAYIFLPDWAIATFGDIRGGHPLYFVATWGPAIAGFSLVAYYSGKKGLRAFLSRVLLWRGVTGWWLLILFGFPLVFMAGSLIKGGPILTPTPEEGFSMLVVLAVIMLFLGPIEEFGWRGIAQPLLQRRVAPFWAGAIIGVAWGIWHLPAFYLSGVVFADWDFLPFFIGNVTLAILVTPILNATRGGLLLPMVFHWQLNLPFWPDAQPWDTWILVALTAVVVWFRREEMFSRSGAVTEVIPGAA